jgi:hypothetical protein
LFRRFRGGRAEPGLRARGAPWLAACLALGLAAAGSAQRLPFTHFSTDDGLAASQV